MFDASKRNEREAQRLEEIIEFTNDERARAWLSAHVRRESPRLSVNAIIKNGMSGQVEALAIPTSYNHSLKPLETWSIGAEEVVLLEGILKQNDSELWGYAFSRAVGKPAVIGDFMQEHGWPWYFYWVVSMNSTGEAVDYRGFTFTDSRQPVEWCTGSFVTTLHQAAFANESRILSDCVQIANRELMAWLSKHPEDLLRTHPGTFELVVAEIFRDQGYEVEVMGAWNQADGGIDILAIRKDTIAGDFRVGIQCKRYVHTKVVRADLVWALEGRLDSFHLHKGVIATTARFENSVLSHLQNHLWRIELRDFERLKMDIEGWGRYERGATGLWLPK